jgi:rhodanese-related sulfurtransferase
MLTGRHLERSDILPNMVRVLFSLPVDECFHGVVGFGPRLGDEEYGPETVRLLDGLVSNLLVALRDVGSRSRVEDLNRELSGINADLRQALESAEQAGKKSDLQAFHLKTLYEASLEMSGLHDPKEVLSVFLLTVLGAVSVSGGCVVLVNDEDGEVLAQARGSAREIDWDDVRIRSSVLGVFVSLKDRIPHAMHSRWAVDPGVLSKLPSKPVQALAFALDANRRGILALGPKIGGQICNNEERELLAGLAGVFMVCLNNALRFATIERLNQGLKTRNLELQQTLDELTSARREIDLLQRARETILNAVRGGRERLERVAVQDVIMILLASILLALLFNSANPGGIPLIPHALLQPSPPSVSLQKALTSTKNGSAVLVDARPVEFFRQGSLPGAVNLPLPLFEFVYSMKLASLPPETDFLVFGRTISSHYDTEVALKLTAMGHENVFIIKGIRNFEQESGS